jgi:hypothetical protein
MFPSILTAGRAGFGVSVVPAEALPDVPVDALSAVTATAIISDAASNSFFILPRLGYQASLSAVRLEEVSAIKTDKFPKRRIKNC